jgi:hypothetical protein
MNDIKYAVMVIYCSIKIAWPSCSETTIYIYNQHAAQSGIWDQYKLFKLLSAKLNVYFASPKHWFPNCCTQFFLCIQFIKFNKDFFLHFQNLTSVLALLIPCLLLYPTLKNRKGRFRRPWGPLRWSTTTNTHREFVIGKSNNVALKLRFNPACHNITLLRS